MAKQRDYLDPGLEAELRRVQAKARRKLPKVDEQHERWREDMVRRLYRDTGDPA